MTPIDPVIWYSDREVTGHTPKHFVKTNTALTTESKFWILNTLKGRFSIMHSEMRDGDAFDVLISTLYGYPAFEDPKEAIVYELTWS